MNKLTELLQRLVDALQAKHLKITSAESCTGGMMASLLTELPGSSLWFDRGFVTYSNLAKQEMLAVKPELIQSYGAVSQKVAEAMALGALAHSAADISIALTGIAGPSGGTREKPVGTLWLAWAIKDSALQSRDYYFPDVSRQAFRQLACERAIMLLNSALGSV